jgi:hypothetical protein
MFRFIVAVATVAAALCLADAAGAQDGAEAKGKAASPAKAAGKDKPGAQDKAVPEDKAGADDGPIVPGVENAHAGTPCPVGDAEAEKAGAYSAAVEAAVKDAPDCEKSFKLFELCQLGASADGALSDIVRAKCEPLFLPKAKPATKDAYKKAQERCNEIAEKTEGSMYQSFAAMCLAGAARDFAKTRGKAK